MELCHYTWQNRTSIFQTQVFTMSLLIDPSDPRYQLGVPSMVETHNEFIDLVNQLEKAEETEFIGLFDQLLQHTEDHFASENELMKTYGFPPIHIHMEEHQRVLDELRQLKQDLTSGSVSIDAARTNLAEQLPAWFNQHIMTMDGALASHLKALQVATDALKKED